MKKNKVDLTSIAEDAGKNAIHFLGKARQAIVHAADQNDDGSLDMKDVAAIAGTIGNAAKNTATAVISTVEARNREKERNSLSPVFCEDLSNTDFLLSKLIRVTEIDKKHAESEICQGAVGFISDQKDLRIVTIFRDKTDVFGITLHPNADCEIYYVDPCDRDHYIALDSYFHYLKIAYVNELQKIAQDLGAKHFRVVYQEKETTVSDKSEKFKGGFRSLGKNTTAETVHDHTSSAMAAVEVAAEMECPGHAPVEPKLVYFRNDPSIKNLISMRMDKTSPLTHQKFTLKFSDSSGIKEKDAVKIDAALKAMKISGATTFVSEVRKDSCRSFEYEIYF